MCRYLKFSFHSRILAYFNAAHFILIVLQVEEGWWRGKLSGKVGVFPSNFVEVIPTPSPISANRQSLNSSNNTPPSVIINATNSLVRNKKNNISLNSSREDLLSAGTTTNSTSHDGYEAPSLPPKPGKHLLTTTSYSY